MGGARSEVSDETTAVLLEAATWNGPNIHRTGLALGLRSEALSRYEKQLQPEQTAWAQAVATQLFVEVCGATVRPGTIDVGGIGSPPPTIRLREKRIERLLGTPISTARAKELLEALSFTTAPADDGLDVTVPDFRRGDISREADLIEEVARLDGIEHLPATLAPARRRGGGQPHTAPAPTPVGRSTCRPRRACTKSSVGASRALLLSTGACDSTAGGGDAGQS